MTNFYKSISFAGLGFLRSRHLAQLQKIEGDAQTLLTDLALRHGANFENIRSQIGQELFVLYSLYWKRDGYFVEFGATNGIDLSNTYLLERDFGWKGILSEPANVWHAELIKNRTAKIDLNCVWSETGKSLPFAVASNAELSTVGNFSNADAHKTSRNSAKWTSVNTISLNDLLERYKAPQVIDYLSIDTEGSEFEILKNFNFNKYIFSIITCEHNFTDQRELIYDLLTRNDYVRTFEGLSRWDDWYVHASILK